MTNTDRSAPPIPEGHIARRIHNTDRVWFEVASEVLYVWHWCTHPNDGAVEPRWVQMGLGLHRVVVGPTGVTIHPSLHFNECCGLHGWITDDIWQNVPVQGVVIQNGQV